MTVTAIGLDFGRQPAALIETAWFEGKVLHRDVFEPAALEIATGFPE